MAYRGSAMTLSNDEFIVLLRLSERDYKAAEDALGDHRLSCRDCQAADLLGSWCENLGHWEHSYRPCPEGQRLQAVFDQAHGRLRAVWNRSNEVPEDQRMGRSSEYEARLIEAYMQKEGQREPAATDA